jgi:exodeoxyribonuclease VII small subunit
MAKTFEESLNELEKIVKQLEDGDLPLEKSLKLFEDGVRLSRECRERLTQAERRIEVLMKDSDGVLKTSELDAEAARSERKTPRGKPVTIATDPDDVPF